MTKQLEAVQERAENVYGSMSTTARKAFHAGLGVVMLAQDELTGLINSGGEFAGKLIDRGVAVEKDGRARIEQAMQERRSESDKAIRQVVQKSEDTLDSTIERVLARLNLPSRKDITALDQQIATLARKVDELAATNAAAKTRSNGAAKTKAAAKSAA